MYLFHFCRWNIVNCSILGLIVPFSAHDLHLDLRMSITEVPKAQNIGFSSAYDKKKLHSKSPDAKSMDGICNKEVFFFFRESGSQISACSLSTSLPLCVPNGMQIFIQRFQRKSSLRYILASSSQKWRPLKNLEFHT